MGGFSKKFMHFGPSDDEELQTTFLGSKIKSWNDVYNVMIIGFFSVLFSAYYNNIVGPWITNVIQDNKTKNINLSKNWAYIITIGDPLLRWINGILGFFITMTLQLQFIIPQVIAEIIVIVFSSYFYIEEKNFNN